MKRVVVVTGASTGMGAEFAKQLAESRKVDEIWIIARRKNMLEQLAKELATKTSAAIKIIAEPICGTTAYQQFSGLFGQDDLVIDTLVNNAGFGTYGPFAETPVQPQLDMIDLNVNALTGICASALPHLKEGSRVINVASLAAYAPLGNFAVYAATKSFVLSFTTALAAELADKGIKVMAVCPGPVATEFAKVASNGARQEVTGGKPADKVVRHALKKLDKGNKVAIMALKWKLKAFLSRFISQYSFARHTYLHEKRPYNHPQQNN